MVGSADEAGDIGAGFAWQFFVGVFELRAVVKQQVLQGEAAAEGAVLAVLDGFAATSNAFAFYRAAVFADDFFFLVVDGVADVGGCVVSGKEVGRFDKPEQIGGEAAEVLFFKAVGGFAGGCFALVFFAARVKQGGAQAAFEGAAGDVWGVAVRVGGGAFDTELVVFGLLVLDFLPNCLFCGIYLSLPSLQPLSHWERGFFGFKH